MSRGAGYDGPCTRFEGGRSDKTVNAKIIMGYQIFYAIMRNWKTASELYIDLELDLVAFQEHCQIYCIGNKNGFVQLFNGVETPIKALAANNVHENVGQTQGGGYSTCCNNHKKVNNTVYKQNWWFLYSTKQDLTCPKTKFWQDLVQQLFQWQEDGEHLMDALMQMRICAKGPS